MKLGKFLLVAALGATMGAWGACKDCGTVVNVKQVKKEGEASGAGAVIGGVAGGVLGHQIGSGRGNTVATVAGAGAGAYAGHQIEKNKNSSTNHQVVVKMEGGKERTFTFKDATSWKVGDKVKVIDGKLTHQ